jgi:hypothetical protein
MPTLDACCRQLLGAAGQGPFSSAREALLMICCKTVLEVMTCSSYKGRSGGSSSDEKVIAHAIQFLLPICGCFGILVADFLFSCG